MVWQLFLEEGSSWSVHRHRGQRGNNHLSQTKFTEKYDTTGLNTKQLDQLRTHELHQQEEALDGLITAVQGIKHTGLAMDK
jgi:hypothetical protein